MATNDILTFAGTSTNILTQAEYAAAAQRSSGNVPGVASSKLVNKAARQSAFVSSMIGQFIADVGGINVVDDNDVAGLEADFLSALTAYVQTRVATTAQAQALTSDSVLLTPKKLSDAFKGANQLLASGGSYQVLPGGLIIQTFFTGNGSGNVTFPIPFPNECLAISGAETAATSAVYAYIPMFGALTRTGVVTSFRTLTGAYAPASGLAIRCVAVGY